MQGVIVDKHPGGMFAIELEGSQHHVLATLGGKLRKNHIRVLTGDRVMVALSPYDLTRGRITFRYR